MHDFGRINAAISAYSIKYTEEQLDNYLNSSHLFNNTADSSENLYYKTL